MLNRSHMLMTQQGRLYLVLERSIILDVQVFRKSLISYSRILRTDHVKSRTYTPLIVLGPKKSNQRKLIKSIGYKKLEHRVLKFYFLYQIDAIALTK